jgi:hypothetical protein
LERSTLGKEHEMRATGTARSKEYEVRTEVELSTEHTMRKEVERIANELRKGVVPTADELLLRVCGVKQPTEARTHSDGAACATPPIDGGMWPSTGAGMQRAKMAREHWCYAKAVQDALSISTAQRTAILKANDAVADMDEVEAVNIPAG